MKVAYKVNEKTYTSYPLMDEIIYNTKLILNGIVVKNEYVAHLYETEETLRNQEFLFKCELKAMTFETFPWTYEIFIAYGYSESEAAEYFKYVNGDTSATPVPMEDREDLTNFAMEYSIETFVEKNKYYRSLIGLPQYGTIKYNVYITEADLPSNFDMSLVDFSIPLHEQPSIVVSALRSNGRLDQIIEEKRSFNYSYLRFLDDHKLDLYECRKAKKWDILFMPDADVNVRFRFEEIYNINRQIYLRRTYQNAYAFRSDYYDHMLIFILLAQTFTDMITDTPEWFIRKDIFDIRTVQFLLEAYGVPYFEEIPLKYQIRIVKNLNKLIKYKGTQQNFEDIVDIFKLRETNIYKYYLYKKRRTDEQGHYIESPDLNEMYELLFIEVLMGDTYDNYIKNLNFRTSYDEVTWTDQYWDGVDTHEDVKYKILEKEFTIEPTKYMTIKADINYMDYQRQIRYLMSMIVDTRVDVEDLSIGIPVIRDNSNFKLSDVFLFICLLNNLESDLTQDMRKPEDRLEDKFIEIPSYEPDNDRDWWLKLKYPELFLSYENRVFGYNPEVDLDEVREVVGRHYSNISEIKYTLADFGCDNFIVPTEDINTYERLLDIYENNMECYDKLNFIITHDCHDQMKQLLARYIYIQLFTKEYDYDLAGTKTTLDSILRDRDYILWDFYNQLVNSTDKDSRNKDIVSVLNTIIATLEYYMDRESLDYFFNFISTSSFSALCRYIYLMLNAFKSYKSHFIEPTISFEFRYPDAGANNYEEINDTIISRNVSFSKFDKELIHDYVNKILYREFIDDIERDKFVELLDIFDMYTPDPDDDLDYDGGTPDIDESEYTKDIDGYIPDYSGICYKTVDGRFSYGANGFSKFMVDGRDEAEDLLGYNILELDAGDISDNDDEFLTTPTTYFNKYFKMDYDARLYSFDTLVNKNIFKRLCDMQTQQDMYVSAITGLKLVEDKESRIVTMKEIWRQWLTIIEYESVEGDMGLLNHLIETDQFEQYYEEFVEKLLNNEVKVFMDELQQTKNHGIDISLTDIDQDSSKDIHSNADFKQIELPRILWIENVQNCDTSRIIEYEK